jgi:hypothetical protein
VAKGVRQGHYHEFYRAKMGAEGLWWGKRWAAGHQWPWPATLMAFKRSACLGEETEGD